MCRPGSFMRLLAAVLIAVVYEAFLTAFRPYKSKLSNYLAMALGFMTTCFLLCCMALKVGELSENVLDVLSAEYAAQYAVSSLSMSALLAAFVLAGLVLFSLLFAQELHERRRERRLAEEAAESPPPAES